MKILYISSRPLEDNSSATFRNRATMSGLIKNGHNVEFLTLAPDCNHPTYDENIKLEGLKTEYLSSGNAENIAHFVRDSFFYSFLKRVYRLFHREDIYDHTKSIVRHAKAVDISRYDVVISSSDPKSSHLFVGEILKYGKFVVPWIQIWGDPFAADITISNPNKVKTMEKEELRLLGLASKIIYVSKLTAEDQQKRYPQYAAKIEYIPTPYFEPIYSQCAFPKEVSEVKFCYCGEYHSSVRNIWPLYEVAKQLHLFLTICGRSDHPVESVDNITTFPRVNAKKVDQIEAESDVLIVIANSSGGQIPGKVYKYASTDKPILFILDGEKEKITEIFGKYNRYIFVDNNVNDIYSVMNNIHNIKDRYSNTPIRDFSSTVVAEQVVDGI